MTFRPLKPSTDDQKKSFLYRKWGSNDAEKLERTHLYILEIVSHRWESLNEAQKEHFKKKAAWEEKWQRIKEQESYI